MVAVVRTSPNFSDPREFAYTLGASGTFKMMDAAGTATGGTVAGFFTELANRGVADNTNWTANTYKTILSVSSGVGVVYGMIGPTGLAGTPTTTFRITVDGVQYTIAIVATTTAQRAYLGACIPDNGSTGALFTVAGLAHRGPDSVSADKTTPLYSTNNLFVPPSGTIGLFGTPGLIYRLSLLVEMKSSENNSTATNQEKQSGVIYQARA